MGEALSDGLSDAELLEFERLADDDEEFAREWLHLNVPDHGRDPQLQQMLWRSAIEGTLFRLSSYAATKWLALHRPGHAKTTRGVVAEVKAEVIAAFGGRRMHSA